MSQETERFDFIICGAGCAGLALAMQLCDPFFMDKRILILDKDSKEQNDRTWCYWEEGSGEYDSIMTASWSRLKFYNEDFSRVMDIDPLVYKMIRAKDYYDFAKQKIQSAKHIEWRTEEIRSVENHDSSAKVITYESLYEAGHVFNSMVDRTLDMHNHNYVDQHFRGWFIETDVPSFKTERATIMDFRVDQKDECRFFYLLPISETKALVEIAIFSNNLLSIEEYDKMIKGYITSPLRIDKYKIYEKEYGVIPMTTYPFEKASSENVTMIGTAGGAAKASTGYAFASSQKLAKTIVDQLKRGESAKLDSRYFNNRYRWYDNILLNVLLNNRAPLSGVFGAMFQKLPPVMMLKFLSNETTFLEEMQAIMKAPKLPFLKAYLSETFGRTS